MMLFVVFGLMAFMGLYETTPMQMIESQITGRNPASVASTAVLKATEVLQVDCSNFDQEISVPAHQVRLEGYLCDKTADQGEVSVRNETTGKTATLFNRGKSKYMTDFIQLADGKNEISLSYPLSSPHKGHDATQKLKKIALTIIK